MRFIAVDLENNQPSGQITQIGAVAFDTDQNKIIGTFNEFLELDEELGWNHPLNGFKGTLGDLLGDTWKKDWEEKRQPRGVVFADFWNWCNTMQCGKKMVQWGKGDMHAIITQSKEVEINYPNHLRIINLKVVYQTFFQPALRLPKAYGLESACKALEIPFEGRAHDALVDAKNTGWLAVKLFLMIENYGKINKLLNT